MLYKTTDDLSESVRHVLPHHGQEIYLKAYNAAHQEYFHKNKRRSENDNLEEICHRVAWAAVKKVYDKNDEGRWIAR